uniref:Putative deoxyribonuclease i n=1 Tax=Corethrella appendiculata TaxID=1370023 RepID=U5ET74_9DIPT
MKMLNFLIIIKIIYSIIFIEWVHCQCRINIQTDIAKNDPIFMTNKYQLMIPNGNQLTWKKNEITYLGCSEQRTNTFQTPKLIESQTTTSIKCVSDALFEINGQIFNSTDFECKIGITGDLNQTNKACAQGKGAIFEIGHDFRKSFNVFIVLIEVCYNMNTASVIYTQNVINGNASSVIESNRPTFKVNGVPSSVSPANSYMQTNQKLRFTTLLDNSSLADFYLNRTSYLARGHLSPDADMIYRSSQFSTYFYLNVAPQWQNVNAGNWYFIESAVRNKATALNEDLLIFNCVYDILKLPHNSGTLIPITLEDAGIEVPNWFIKIVLSNKLKASIAFVTSNNPFMERFTKSDLLCNDICQPTKWNTVLKQSADITKGYTICCNVNELRGKINFIGSEWITPNILNY